MSRSDRTKLQLRRFADALATLKDQAQENETRAMRDSLLLRFVYTFEMAWQSMHQILKDRGDVETPRVAYEVLAAALRSQLIADGDLWRRLRDARNAVTHVYDEAKAVELAALVRRDAIAEFERVLAILEHAG